MDQRVIETLEAESWTPGVPPAERDRALLALEAGHIVYLPRLSFAIEAGERRFLDPAVSNGRAKNVSYDPVRGTIGGSRAEGADRTALAALLRRYFDASRGILTALFPDYAAHLTPGRTSFRPARIEGRVQSSRKDDTRLHVDAFPSQPVRGRRILRVFSNIDPGGEPRVWRVGEDFPQHAARFLPRRTAMLPGGAAALALLRITKERRSDYDRLMLALHDRAKADEFYQRNGIVAEPRFPAGSTWIVYTDCRPHAAIAGQHAMEQTFYLPPAAMRNPAAAPLHVLETLTGRSLVA